MFTRLTKIVVTLLIVGLSTVWAQLHPLTQSAVSFLPAVDYSVGYYPYSVAVGDFPPTAAAPNFANHQASATGLSSLPADAQGPVSSALGKDDSSYWSQQTELTASDGAAIDEFGYSVAVSRSTAVLGTP